MNTSPKKKTTVTFSADKEIIATYKEYCKEHGLNQSLMVEAFMRCFYEGKLTPVFKNNRFEIV